jgi:hypothetical protein
MNQIHNVVSMRMKKNSATVCDMGLRMKRGDHGINPNVQAQRSEGLL